MAIFLLITLFSLIILIIYGARMTMLEQEETYYCYYDVCGDYPEAYYEDKVCMCYDYDLLGNLQIVKTDYLG